MTLYRRRAPTRSIRKRVQVRASSRKRSVLPVRKTRVVLRRKRFPMKRASLMTAINKPRQFAKVYFDYNLDRQSIAASSQQAITLYPQFMTPTDNSGSPPAATPLWQGMETYAKFYRNFRLHGVKLTATVFNAGTTQQMRTILLSYPLSSDGQTASGNSVSTVGAYNWAQLSSMPFTRRAMLGLATGSRNQAKLTMYRSTKAMLNRTSIRDDYHISQPLDTSLAHGSWTSTPSEYFVMQLVTFNVDGTNAQVVDYNFRMVGYGEFFNHIVQVENVLT